MTVDSLVEKLESLTPGFSSVWAEWLKEDEEYGNGELPSFHEVFLEYNFFIIPKIDDLSQECRIQLFGYVEETLNSGGDKLSNAVATCFLESLVQKSDDFKPENCFPFLGVESKAHCKAWDDFNGVKTRGLW